MTDDAGRGGRFGKADLHVHTAYGDGMAQDGELLDYIEERTDLSVVAIVDHDDIAGGLKTRDMWARGRYSFEVLVGMEVSTLEGHILALGIERPVPSMRSLTATLEAVHVAGGYCVVPHPMSWLTRSLGRNGIERILQSDDPAVRIDGIEVGNPSPAGRVSRARARASNDRHWHLAAVGGSDAHFLQAIGTAHTAFRGHTIADLRTAFDTGTTTAGERPYPTLLELGYLQVARQQWRGLMVTPRNVLVRPLSRLLTGGPA